MIAELSLFGHVVAAGLFALLAGWQLSRRDRRRAMAMLGIVFASVTLWGAMAAWLSPDSLQARAAETLRNIGFLGFMFLLTRRESADGERHRFMQLVYVALLFVGALQLFSDLLFSWFFPSAAIAEAVYAGTALLQLVFVIGGLFLIQALYTSAGSEARWGLRPIVIALAAMWAYDLNLYTLSWIRGEAQQELLALRGMYTVALVPFFAISLRRSDAWRMKLSRTVTFRSLSMLAIVAYFGLMYLLVQGIDRFAGAHSVALSAGLVLVMSVGAAVFLPSRRARNWFKVKLAKHFFEHRYDYRAEWIRFNRTLAHPDADADPLNERVVRAIAEITASRGGILLVSQGESGLVAQARWNWAECDLADKGADAMLCKWLATSGHIVEIDAIRADIAGDARNIAILLPRWMVEDPRAWVLVPLIHREELAGAVLLERPIVDRQLDWEDLDLLRIAGRQAASYLAEARGQEELAEARRFEEFNRRFAFIMHDLKNVASQLGLVARNAEKHAENPEFRADMVATLRSSVDKMNDLLARLSPQQRTKAEPAVPCELSSIVASIAKQKRAIHPIELDTEADCTAMADHMRLETALAHLIQNAIEASPANEPVRLETGCDASDAWIAIVDHGQGMSAAFIRDELYRPFNSSKQNGFGIGAFEARALVAEMGGTLHVESREGEGTCFTITLPRADALTSKEKVVA